MRQRLRGLVFETLDVPEAPPRIPENREEIRFYQPDLRRHYVRFGFWGLSRLAAMAFLITAMMDLDFDIFAAIVNWSFDSVRWAPGLNLLPETWLSTLAWAVFLSEFTVGFLFYLLLLGPKSQWFFLHDDGIGSRVGIWTIREKYTTWGNVQTFSLKQNPIQTLLGVGDIIVRVAGADKEEKETPKRAIVFRDIRDAKALYEELLERLDDRRAREPEPEQTERSPEPRIMAANEISREARLLREELTRSEVRAS